MKVCLLLAFAGLLTAQSLKDFEKKVTTFTLANGLSVKGSNGARDYRFRYDGRDGLCRFDLVFTGLMDPFDPLDPQQNTMLARFGGDAEAATGAGDAWTKGHYDLVGRIEGELELHGHRFTVSCVDGLDRSWGPRAEWNSAPVSDSWRFWVRV